jgi:biotin carboxyl carrier protein
LIGASASSDLAAPYSAPMNGTVAAILVAVNDEVDAGTILMVVEAMKMEFPIMSQHKGSVREFFFAEGDNVEQGNTLLDLEAT